MTAIGSQPPNIPEQLLFGSVWPGSVRVRPSFSLPLRPRLCSRVLVLHAISRLRSRLSSARSTS